jgi:2-polyprenyl-3-methyl-5-hydroxy-6-metoxy-1,4-benzoquinol methylase
VLKYRLFHWGLFYDPLLDFDLFESEHYYFKQAPNSLHQRLLKLGFAPGEEVVELGAAAGRLAAAIAERGARVTAVDRVAPAHAGRARTLACDLDGDFRAALGEGRFDTVLAIDVIEHLDSPETAVERIGALLRPGGRLLASTGNIAYFITRAMLAVGTFQYGKRGILDLTHKRLFTVGSFLHLLRTYGFEPEAVHGFGPPIRDLVSSRWPFRWLDATFGLLARAWPRLFAYNFLVVARRRPALEELYRSTFAASASPVEAVPEPSPAGARDSAMA